VSESAQQAVSGASKETNKRTSRRICKTHWLLTLSSEVAKDSDASLGTRASAAKDAVGDKMDESGHSVCTTLQTDRLTVPELIMI